MLIFKSFIKLQHFILIMISSASLPPNSSDYSPLNTHPSLFSINYLLSIIYSLFTVMAPYSLFSKKSSLIRPVRPV